MGDSSSKRESSGVREMLDFLSSHSPHGEVATDLSAEVLWSPPADVYELDDRLYVLLEIAGMKSKEFRIRVEGNTLSVRGERRTPHHQKNRRFHSMEWQSGLFEKRIALPRGYDPNRPTSRYLDGILEICFPSSGKGSTP